MDVKLIAFSVTLSILAIAMGSIGIDCVRKNNGGKKRKSRLIFLSVMLVSAILALAGAIYMSRKSIMKSVVKAGVKAGARAGAVAGANAGAVMGAAAVDPLAVPLLPLV